MPFERSNLWGWAQISRLNWPCVAVSVVASCFLAAWLSGFLTAWLPSRLSTRLHHVTTPRIPSHFTAWCRNAKHAHMLASRSLPLSLCLDLFPLLGHLCTGTSAHVHHGFANTCVHVCGCVARSAACPQAPVFSLLDCAASFARSVEGMSRCRGCSGRSLRLPTEAGKTHLALRRRSRATGPNHPNHRITLNTRRKRIWAAQMIQTLAFALSFSCIFGPVARERPRKSRRCSNEIL